MDRKRLAGALTASVPAKLADDLVDSFLAIRQDAATKTFGRAAPGKFVETVVQVLQHLATGTHDPVPNVEDFLQRKVENTAIDDGLRICAARIARAMYALRSKRNIAHKGSIDPNSYDLDFVHAGARWIMAELLWPAQGLTMEQAGALIEMVHAPVGKSVEEIDGRRIVHADLGVRSEILVLLYSHYPDHVATDGVLTSLDRQDPSSVKKRIPELYQDKLVQGGKDQGYRLTSPGFDAATTIIAKLVTL